MLFRQIIRSISCLIHILLFTLKIILEPTVTIIKEGLWQIPKMIWVISGTVVSETGSSLFKLSRCGLVAKLCPTLVTPWTVAHQSPLSMGFPRQEHRNRLPFPSTGYLPYPGIKPASPVLQTVSWIAGRFFTTEPPGFFILLSIKTPKLKLNSVRWWL